MDSFSSFLSSFDSVGKKSKKSSKSANMKKVESYVKPTTKSPKLLTQEIPRDHNYNKKSDVVEMFSSSPSVNNNALEELDPATKSKTDSSQDHETCNKLHSESSLHQASREKCQALLSREKVESGQDRSDDCHEGSDRKRKLVNDDAFPDKKKPNVDGIFSHKSDEMTRKLKKVKDMKDIGKEKDPTFINMKYPQQECIIKPSSIKDAKTCLPQEEVTPQKVANSRSIDYRCILCNELPRKPNRSELYRHYANCHFSSNLYDLFGHYKICPHCGMDLRNVGNASHFGQKHSFVENFLPKEAWIPLSSTGAKIAKTKTGSRTSNSNIRKRDRKKLDQVKNNEDLPFEAFWVWPEIPEGFNPDGNVRESERGFKNNEQSTILANVEGFDIENVKDECSEQEGFVIHSEASSLSPSAPIQEIQCRICKMKFDQKQLSVLHVQSVHVMKGSGDVFHDFGVLLRSGYLVQKTSSSTVRAASVDVLELCQDTAVEEEAQSMDLTEEEWGLVNAVDIYQQSEGGKAAELVPSHKHEGGRSEAEGEIECAAFCVESYGNNEYYDKSDSEVEYDPKAYFESDEPLEVGVKDWEEALAVESIKDLQVIIPGRESGYGSTSGYSGYSSQD